MKDDRTRRTRVVRQRARPSRLDPAARQRALDALALSRREGVSLTRASKAVGTTSRTVRRYAPSGFRQEGRQWRPTKFDRIPREMTILTPTGPETVVVRDSRTATKIAVQANAVRRYIEQGDEAALREIARGEITVAGHRYHLALDANTLDRLAEGAELHYELYRR